MSPLLTFWSGLGLLVLLCWYLFTDSEAKKRILGTILTVLVTAFCVVSVTPPFDVKDGDKIIQKGKIPLGLDLQGGTSFLISLVAEPVETTNDKGEKIVEQRTITKEMVDQAVEVIRKRVDRFGVSEPIITPQGADRILVQIPGLTPEGLQETRDQLQKVAKLEFRKVHPQSMQIVNGMLPPDPNYMRLPHIETDKEGNVTERGEIIVRKKVDLEGVHVIRAGAGLEAKGWVVHLNFDSYGADVFGKLTTEVYNDKSQLAIVLDGKVISAPGVNDGPILGGRCEISGSFDEKGARNLASALENPLQTPVKIIEERQVSASLGASAIKSGIYSGIAGLVLVAVFMIIYYRFVGFIAIVALMVNCVMVVGAMGMFGSVLTLPGIAGLILSLGIAVDANVLIYERLREELDEGKLLKPAVQSSYNKAFSAIFDAHVTQFLTAAILYWLATGPVKGFALTLTIGIVASMFSSLLITYTCFEWAFLYKVLNKISMLHLIKAKRFDFLGNAKPIVTGSAIAVLLCLAVFGVKREHVLGADFKGGDLLVFSSKQKVTTDQVRNALEGTGLQNSGVTEERVGTHEVISIRGDHGSAEKIKVVLNEKLGSSGLTFEQTETIGALVGKELATKSALALALGLLGIFIYVSMRFEASFAFGSLIALGHDLIITLGIFALSGRELSLIMVAAVLTIAGYSINDKIVVFDRIRSGLRDRGTRSIADVMNNAINDTLSRTILTGGTVLLTVLALYFFGGPVLNDFAFSFVVGVIVGTYSSIFIAAPIVLWWARRSGSDLTEKTPVEHTEVVA